MGNTLADITAQLITNKATIRLTFVMFHISLSVLARKIKETTTTTTYTHNLLGGMLREKEMMKDTT